MGASSGILAASMISTGAEASGAISQAGAIKAQGAYQSSQATVNAHLADLQAQDATTRGDEAAQVKAKDIAQLKGNQRANFAASGVALDSGSAAEVQADTDALGELDQLTIRNNAAREAMGYQVQASNYRGQAKQATEAADNNARNTILIGGMNALSTAAKGYSNYRKSIGGPTKKDSAEE